jgi:hypothetical protein
MLKLRALWLALAGLALTHAPAPGLAHEGYANRLQPRPAALNRAKPDESEPPPPFELSAPGICRLYNLSGYFALDAAGAVLPLRSYCQEQQNWAWYLPGEFWQNFRQVASPETLNYVQTLDRDEVEAYAQAICPFLDSGAMPEDLARIQADQQFPPAFEQAVSAAAIRTYCPDYRP